MRLEKIKLAGFKSFVDPTTAAFPTNLVGVVGPNGCGKSNIIDAVRWVMGESSAKMLRGESMADVIFNGSSSRKPVGTATIELVFDNSDGSAGGQYASYSQISVKRQVSRDGQSSYFLNNVRCRRRDITDLFLGTGLGPRSYSIIEQGMISRVIEAKPEELRVYLEEAAGISKYKERRRETENRIKHTRENLDRLEDLIEEVTKQLKHLERQAATAGKYKRFKAEERELRGELLLLRWKAHDEEMQQGERKLAEQENRLEAAITTQRELEAAIEEQRAAHTDANDDFNKVQGRYYALGSEIARLEQSIQYARETRQKQKEDLQQLETSFSQISSELTGDETRLLEITETLEQQLPELEQSRELEHEILEQLAQAEQAHQQWQMEWDSFIQQANKPAQEAQVERTRINHLEEQEQQLLRRIRQNREESERLHQPELETEIARLEQLEAEKAAEAEQLQEALDTTRQQIAEQREQQMHIGNRLDDVRGQLQSSAGRLSSLEALQQAAMSEDEQSLRWLDGQGLRDAGRLAEQVDVDPEWRGALETVLGHHLQAVCVDGLEDYHAAIGTLDDGLVELISPADDAAAAAEDSLLHKARSSINLTGLLGSVRLADSVSEAMSRRRSLGSGESLITREGVWVGSNWVRFGTEQGAQHGVLERQQEIRQLESSMAQLEQQVEQQQSELEAAREALRESEQQREERQQAFNELNRELSDVRSRLSGKRTRIEHLQNRLQALLEERSELEQQIEAGKSTAEASLKKLHEALGITETMDSRRSELEQQRDQLRENVQTIRKEAQQKRQSYHELALRTEALRSQQEALSQGQQRMKAQLEQMTARRAALREQLEGSNLPLQQQQETLENQLQSRLVIENELGQARKRLETIDNDLRTREQQRHQVEQKVQNERSALEKMRMQRQELVVRARTLEEQMREESYDRGELEETLPPEANLEEWQQRVETIAARIQRLGPINLAAIDEFREQSERMEYLEKQHQDIISALETLEDAIRKIDRETRTRFKETFEMVNSGFRELFPILFGGGQAVLELTGEDLLDTGVSVMARPPGKRNSSIHLLSGGEKALTAVALVFAIFRLNPAPFCMLDEVDAPLDDANVGRFCDMVRQMSENVQFIFITHNKITMELANQLQGVTMHEPGVSRLVSVDVEEAAQMAAM
ncbi:MAG: chromosome segregation protein SMC [Gammaproteobacteria bacterium]